MIKPVSEGGVNFPSPEYRIKSQKLIWLKKLFFNETQQIWRENFKSHCSTPLELIGLGSTIFKNSKNQFVTQILQIWREFSRINPPTSPEQVVNEALWFNEYLRFHGKGIFFTNWYSAGYKVVGDIWKF